MIGNGGTTITRSGSPGVEVSVRLQQAPEVAVVGDGVFQNGGRQQRLLVRRHALHHDLFQ